MTDTQTQSRERVEMALAAATAMCSLNRRTKQTDDHRHTINRLKDRLIHALWTDGYCIAVEPVNTTLWSFVFAVDGVRFRWHLPDAFVRFAVRAFQGPPVRLVLPADVSDQPLEQQLDAVRAYLKLAGC